MVGVGVARMVASSASARASFGSPFWHTSCVIAICQCQCAGKGVCVWTRVRKREKEREEG